MDKNKAFRLEEKRQVLASNNKLHELKLLYGKSLPEIPNLNTSVFWDKKIDDSTDYLPEKGITVERVMTAYQFLPKSSQKILDIGAGYGYVERLLSRDENIQIYGNDISKNAIKNLKRKYKGNFRLESIYEMNYKMLMFDAVFMLEVLEHIPPSKVFKVFKKIKSLLKKKGFLIISVPTNEGLENMRNNINGHVRMYTVDLIVAELRLCGFEVLKVKTLIAFKNFYFIKKIISKFFKSNWSSNNIVILAKSI